MLAETADGNNSSCDLDELLASIAARRDEIERKRHVPRDLVDMMKRAGIFRAATPARFGGDALPPSRFLPIVEAIAAVDGSAAWIAAFGSANTYLAALPLETQAIVYAAGPDQVFAGGLYPVRRAEAADGGWTVSGRWRFASGCMAADWIGVGIATGDETSAAGAEVRMAVAPAAEVTVIENWDVVGMQGTGSHDTSVVGRYYAREWTCLRGAQGLPDEPLYRYPTLAYQAQSHAACNLGLARAALDSITGMAAAEKSMPGASPLADRAYFRSALAQGEARLRSARAFFYQVIDDAWDLLEQGDDLDAEARNLLRLGASWAAKECFEVIQSSWRVAGMTGIHKSHRLQAIVRDAMVVTQHASLNDATFEEIGSHFAGRGKGL